MFVCIIQPMNASTDDWLYCVWWFSVLCIVLVVYSILSLFLYENWQSMQQLYNKSIIIPCTSAWKSTTYNSTKNSSSELKPKRKNKYKRGKAYNKVSRVCIYSKIQILLLFFLFLHVALCCCPTCYYCFPVISLLVNVLLSSKRLWPTGISLEYWHIW